MSCPPLVGGFAHFLELGDAVDRLVEGDLQLRGNELGDGVNLSERHADDSADIADDGFGAHGPEGDDLTGIGLAVLVHHVLDDAIAVGEIDVEIWGSHALGIEHALEDEVVLDGVGVADLQAVSDQATGARAAARSHGDARGACEVDVVPYDEEIVDEASGFYDVELVVESPLQGLVDPFVPVPQALVGQLAQELKGICVTVW